MEVTTNPGGRVVLARGVIPTATDWARLNQLPLQVLMDLVLWPLYGDGAGDAISGFFGDSLQVSAVSGRTIQVAEGVGFQLLADTTPEDEPRYRPVVNVAAAEYELDDPEDPAERRIDLVVVKAAEVAETESRDVKNLDVVPVTVAPATVTVLKRPDRTLLIVKGAEGVSPVAPSVPAGYITLAQVLVEGSGVGGATTVTDVRNTLLRMVDIEPRLTPKTGKSLIGPGSWYGPTISGTSHASTLVQNSGTRATVTSTAVGAVATYLAPLDLPHGSTITSLAAVGHRAASGGTFELNVRRIARTGFKSDSSSLVLTGSPGDIDLSQEEELGIDLENYRYELRLQIDNPASAGQHELYTAEVGYAYL